MKAVEAKGFLAQIKSFRFLLHLVIFERVLSCTKSLSDLLQHEHCDLVTAVNLISSTIETLKEFRSDSSWDHLYSYSEQVAKLNQIPLHSQMIPPLNPPLSVKEKSLEDMMIVLHWNQWVQGKMYHLATVTNWLFTFLFWIALFKNLTDGSHQEIWRS